MKKTLAKKVPLTNGHSFSDSELNLALIDIDDILGRALCEYILLGDTAKSLTEDTVLYGDGIYIGVEQKNVTETMINTVKFYLAESRNSELRDDGFDYEWNGVPIHVKFIKRRYKFFKYPDFKFYYTGEYRVPNPFETYWKSRFLIK